MWEEAGDVWPAVPCSVVLSGGGREGRGCGRRRGCPAGCKLQRRGDVG